VLDSTNNLEFATLAPLYGKWQTFSNSFVRRMSQWSMFQGVYLQSLMAVLSICNYEIFNVTLPLVVHVLLSVLKLNEVNFVLSPTVSAPHVAMSNSHWTRM